MKDQHIFKRYEIKYLLSKNQYDYVISRLSDFMSPDPHGHGHIQSLYYDTPDFLLARRSIDKPLYKEKLRVRSYGVASPDTPVFIEIKKKFEGVTYKRRIGLPFNDATVFLTQDKTLFSYNNTINSQISSEIEYFLAHYQNLKPAILLQYERDAFYSLDSLDFRVTFDSNIAWRTDNLLLNYGFYGEPLIPSDTILMEVKVGTAIPTWFANLLTENQIFQSSFSKYGTAFLTLEKKNDNFIHKHI